MSCTYISKVMFCYTSLRERDSYGAIIHVINVIYVIFCEINAPSNRQHVLLEKV